MDIDIIRNNINIHSDNINYSIDNNKLILKHNEEIIKEYNIVSYTSNKYDLSKDNILLIGEKLNLDNISTINCTKEILDNKLVIKYNNNIIKEISIFSIISDKYDMSDEFILIYGDNDVNTIKSNINVSSNNVEVDVDMNNYSLKIKSGNAILKDYEIIVITSSKYTITKRGIYIGDNEFNINDVTVLNGNKQLSDNKLVISYNGLQLNSLSIINSELEEDYLEFNKDIKVDDDKKIIDKIKYKTTIEDIRNNINTNGNISIFDRSNNIISDNSKNIGTGYKVRIEGSNQVYEYLVSVKGDVSGDSLINVMDIVEVANSIVSKKKLEDVYYSAADYNEDDNINVMDIVEIANLIVNGK